MPPAVMLRTMTPDDVDAGLRLCRLSHWNQVARDWDQFLRLTPGGATVATDEAGVVIGSVATVRYAAARHESKTMVERDRNARLGGDSGPPPSMAEGGAGLSQAGVPGPSGGENWGLADRGSRIGKRESGVAEGSGPARWDSGPLPPPKDWMAWIAMVLVDPAHRGSGIGTSLLQRGLADVADVTTVGLDATPLGRPLYEALGFRADGAFTRMRREPAPRGPLREPARHQQSRVRTATPADHDAIAALDARATGLDRRAMLAWLQNGAPELAWVCEGARGIEGAVLGRPGYAAIHLGPVIAPSTDVAAGLVGAVLSAQGEHPVIVDVADDRPGWRHAVEALGFQAQRPFTRMYRGLWRPPADLTRLFAIIGAEFG